MKCERCMVPMIERKATDATPYAYRESGLRNVFLCGIIVRTCPRCKAESAVIPRIGELNRVIAEALVRKQTYLTGTELRFLRKNAGFPAAKFSALLGVNPSHLSRIENGHYRGLGKPTDRLARALAVAAGGGEDVRKVLLRMADELESRRLVRRPPKFRLVRNQWRQAA